jgi:hypothetical protein
MPTRNICPTCKHQTLGITACRIATLNKKGLFKTLSLKIHFAQRLSNIMLSVTFIDCFAEACYAVCRYADCHNAEYRGVVMFTSEKRKSLLVRTIWK